jgi:hypothetical protein
VTVAIDFNGWKERKSTPLSSVGVFPYLGKEIPGAPDPSAIYYVLRPEEELSSPACIESFKLLPWVDEHTHVGPGFVPAEQKGVHGVVGQDVYYQDGYMYGNLKAFSDTLAALIDSGKRELSCGYRCKYEYAPGIYNGQAYDYVQREIRGNHLALVDEGRMGPGVCVRDGVDLSYTITLDSKEFLTMADGDVKKDGDEGGKGGEEMTLADVIKFVKEIGPQLAEMQKAVAAFAAPKTDPTPDPDAVVVDEDKKDEAITAMDSQIKTLGKQLEDLRKDGVKTFMAEISSRDELAASLSAHVGVFDHKAMTLGEVAKYGVEKLAIACDSGHEVTAVRAYLKDRKAPSDFVSTFTGDASVKGESQIDAYLKGGAK